MNHASDAIRLEGVTKHYESFSLKDISLTLPRGTVMGLIGENGAGKTTLLKSILGLVHSSAGRATLLGEELPQCGRDTREKIGVVFEESRFPDNLTAKHISKIMANICRSWDDAQFWSLLRRFDLPEKQAIKEFSRGMRTKMMIASALAHHPQLLILDEATSGLDPVVREEILDLFLEFIQDEQNAILISSHITSDLDKIADYIAYLHKGELMFCRSKDELMSELGILRCSKEELATVEPSHILRVREHRFGAEALVQDRELVRHRHPALVVDNINIEEMMLFYARGEEPA